MTLKPGRRSLYVCAIADRSLTPDLAEFVAGGVAIIVATRDAGMRPTLARGWGAVADRAAGTVSLCVTSPPGSATRANLQDNGAIAVTFSRPTTYETVQLKGHALEVGQPEPRDLERVEEHLADFIAEVMQVGLPPEYRDRAIDRPLVAVRFRFSEMYDQTPGPRAGAPL